MSKDILIQVFIKAKKKKLIDEEFISFLDTIFPGRATNVIDVLKRGIIKYVYTPSNRTVWAAKGENQEHLIYPKLFCSCQDFYKNVVIKRNHNFCKHILAQIISEALNKYQIINLEEHKFNELLRDLKLKI